MALTNTLTRNTTSEDFGPNGRHASRAIAEPLQALKNGIWLYFILLIFEGGLRKWVLPSLASPLLIIRDPVALWLIYKSVQMGVLKSNFYLTSTIVIITVSIFTAMILGHGNIFVALYGARIFLIHFPLIFVIGQVFTMDDVVKMGRVAVYISIPMTVLVALQFYSPQSAWVNRGVGGDMEGAGFNGGALGYFRPPGTFSFTNGNVLYYSFLAPFIYYFWLYPKSINRLILIVATISMLAAIPLSISRSLFFQVVITTSFLVVGILRKPELVGKLLTFIVIGAIAFMVIAQIDFFKTSLLVFSTRYEGANESEGGLKGVFLTRYLNSMLGGLDDPGKPLPFFGLGLGMGTSVGSTIMGGSGGLQISEDEWGRLIGELGVVMGLSIIFVRIGLYVKMIGAAWGKLTVGNLLPWLLASFAMPNTPLGQWSQPAGLGFGIMISGLMLAALSKGTTDF